MSIVKFLKSKKHKYYNDNVIKNEYKRDCQNYINWHYKNPENKTQNAMEAKILRQTHILEKGMSLSNPRAGFGKDKINELFKFIDEYISMGYDTNSAALKNAVNVLFAYIEFQKNLNFENEELNQKINSYGKYFDKDMSAGIIHLKKEDVLKDAKSDFERFFNSRHSVRQFDSKPVDTEIIKKAVKLAMKAPSACNRQSAKVYLFKNKDDNKYLSEYVAGNTGFADEVQNYLVITADVSAFYDAFERNQIYVDGTLLAMSLVEALHYYGIGSCMLQNGEICQKDKEIRNRLKVFPDNEKIILFIAVGYYKDEFNVAVSQRKNVEDVFKVID